ncbi:cyclophilin-like fold protein [uncultured Limosilactobacillus sp.]|uniref:cyclophilin-like fold protein n=1 Tax=uncultured Limosilactobacillus sp. TaxID=2837629 RepID=UPI0025F26F64|nr:cyclophilin-like fold protein [uncultured Limosilactobacillus sp.]
MIENQHTSTTDNRVTKVEKPTGINLVINGQTFSAVLNDSQAAQALIDKLPYTITASQGAHDYCGVMEHLPYDQNDVQAGWFDGDLSFDISGDWFALFLRGANNDARYQEVNLGQLVNKEDIAKIAQLPATVDITIELAK